MRYGFFNSDITGYDESNNPIFDRAEDAEFFARFYKSFFGNGIFPNPSTNLQVVEHTEMRVKVLPGLAFIEGHFAWEDAERALTVQAANTTFDRIDRVVLRLDYAKREIDLYVKEGIATTNPTAPSLTRPVDGGGDIYELGIADIFITKNATQIAQEKITDLRYNSELCGIVVNTLESIDTTTLFAQLQDQVNSNIPLIQSAIDETLAWKLQTQIFDLTPKEIIIPITVSDWIGETAPYYATLNVVGIKEDSIIQSTLANKEEMTEEEYDAYIDALQEANITHADWLQTTDTLVYRAKGKKPIIDLKIKILLSGGSSNANAIVMDYDYLANKPLINQIELNGNKSMEELDVKYLRNAELDPLLK